MSELQASRDSKDYKAVLGLRGRVTGGGANMNIELKRDAKTPGDVNPAQFFELFDDNGGLSMRLKRGIDRDVSIPGLHFDRDTHM